LSRRSPEGRRRTAPVEKFSSSKTDRVIAASYQGYLKKFRWSDEAFEPLLHRRRHRSFSAARVALRKVPDVNRLPAESGKPDL
jgi:hypothetical protein